MTILEAINQIDELKPNTCTQQQKIMWLSELDGLVFRQILLTHEGAEAVTFNGYTVDTRLDTPLLIAAPYDSVYRFYLAAQIDLANDDNTRYNAAIITFNDRMNDFECAYNGSHRPVQAGTRFIF